MTSKRDPLCKYEHEPPGDEGFWETTVFFLAVFLTFVSGFFRGNGQQVAFVVTATLAGLAFAWLIFTGEPTPPDDKDKLP